MARRHRDVTGGGSDSCPSAAAPTLCSLCALPGRLDERLHRCSYPGCGVVVHGACVGGPLVDPSQRWLCDRCFVVWDREGQPEPMKSCEFEGCWGGAGGGVPCCCIMCVCGGGGEGDCVRLLASV
jgi:hypothetical protein